MNRQRPGAGDATRGCPSRAAAEDDPPVRIIALTGGIATGKSTVAGMLAGDGAAVVDADRIAREVVEPGTPGLKAVVEAFGRALPLRAGGWHWRRPGRDRLRRRGAPAPACRRSPIR